MTEEETNSKNIVTLRDHFEHRFVENEKAQDMFAKVLDARLRGMNEFREDLRRQAGTFLTRQEFTVLHDRVVDDIKSLRESRAEATGKASQLAVNITFLLALMSMVVALLGLWTRLR